MLKYYLGLNKIPVIRGNRLKNLLEHFGTPENIWKASKQEIKSIKGMKEEVVEEFFKYKENINLDEEINLVEKENISLLTLDDKDYPKNLKNIYDPPPILYIKGEIRKEDEKAIAMVGSRKSSFYGEKIAERLAEGLVEKGFTIVSGMARGIDTYAHKGALKNKGRTIAVLGCGVDVIYPKENKEIYSEIAKLGAVVSEFPLKTPPLAMNFPIRNRVISGLALGVVVVQAGEKSGARITANFALEQGREVFAIPGNINEMQSKGPHYLIKQGAKLVEDVNDILEEFGISPVEVSQKNILELPEVEKIIFDTLSFEPKYIDEIIKESNLPTQNVLSGLSILEMKGLIKQLPGKMFVRI